MPDRRLQVQSWQARTRHREHFVALAAETCNPPRQALVVEETLTIVPRVGSCTLGHSRPCAVTRHFLSVPVESVPSFGRRLTPGRVEMSDRYWQVATTTHIFNGASSALMIADYFQTVV
jgi:hypothetical protein